MITEIIFPGSVPGNNGKKGLLRMSARQRTKLRNSYTWHVLASTRNRHYGPVRFELVRHTIGRPMDFDNIVSTGKLLTDALVAAGVIPDDTPQVITERHYSQTKAINQQSQFTVIRIIDL